MRKPKKLYLVWQSGEDANYFAQYESIEEAVCSEADECEVYEATPVLVGKFKMAAIKIEGKKEKKS